MSTRRTLKTSADQKDLMEGLEALICLSITLQIYSMGLRSSDLMPWEQVDIFEVLANSLDTIHENDTVHCFVERRRLRWDVSNEQTKAHNCQEYSHNIGM